jgi:hypothetical protein
MQKLPLVPLPALEVRALAHHLPLLLVQLLSTKQLRARWNPLPSPSLLRLRKTLLLLLRCWQRPLLRQGAGVTHVPLQGLK